MESNGKSNREKSFFDLRGVREPLGNEIAFEGYSMARRSINWRAIFAGALISALAYLALISLGVAIGGAILPNVIRGTEGGGGLGLGTGIWLVASLVISLFFGSYLASRVSGLLPSRVGGVQGLTIAALFFGVLLSGIGTTIGGIGSLVSTMGGAAGAAAQNSQVQSVVQDALGDLPLKSSPQIVASNIAGRLIRGDSEGAKAYLARETGLPRAEIDRRFAAFSARAQSAMQNAGAQAAKAASVAGWTVFGALVLGGFFAWLGGIAGMRRNQRTPLSDAEFDRIRESKAA